MDQDEIKVAEERIARVQDAREHVQGALRTAERAQRAAEHGAEVMRTVALTALGGLVAVALVIALHRHQHPAPDA